MNRYSMKRCSAEKRGGRNGERERKKNKQKEIETEYRDIEGD
jgi:hypothetical protein